ncbi:MAG: hypothetical protein ACJAZN_001044, partial [Planctomycetota bacterium]
RRVGGVGTGSDQAGTDLGGTDLGGGDLGGGDLGGGDLGGGDLGGGDLLPSACSARRVGGVPTDDVSCRAAVGGTESGSTQASTHASGAGAPTAAGLYREIGTGRVSVGRDTAHASSAGAPTAAGRHREVGTGQVGTRHDCYQGTECRTVRLLRHRAVFMRPSPDGAGAIMSLCARRAGVLAGRACCRTGLLAGGAARASLAPSRTSPTGTRYGPGVLRTRGGGFGHGGTAARRHGGTAAKQQGHA